MDVRDILLFIAAAINLGFASAILFKNPKQAANASYGLTVVATAFWTAGIAMFRLSDVSQGLAWARFYYVTAALIATYFLYFGIHFPHAEAFRLRWWQHLGLHLPVLAFAYLVFTPAFIAAYALQPWGKEITLGPAYFFYAAFWASYMALAFLLMLGRVPAAAPIEKLQLKFVLTGTLVAAIGGSIPNLFLPLVGNYRWIWIGPYPTLFMVVLIGYAIAKHRILNIRLIAAEIFSAALIVIFLVQFLRSETLPEYLLQGLIVLASTVFFVLLNRATNREVAAREEIAKLATELSRANAELKQLDQAKSEFISIAGHQLRAPLTIIKGYVSMLLEGTLGQASDLAKESMAKVATATEQLIRLVGDLLDLSRIEAGRLKYDFQKVLLADAVTEVAKELEVIARAKGLALTQRTIDTRRSAVRADPDKIREVVMNLIDNAIKYTARGRITAELVPEERDGRRWLRFSVTDTGIGIKTADLGKIFTKFARTEEARRLRPDGMGLGLYIVKKIVEDHGGRVAVSSPGLGQGSTFSVTLPAL